MDHARVNSFLVIFLILTFINFAPETQRPVPHRPLQRRGLLDVERHALDVLNKTNDGDFDPSSNRWLNLTGLRQDDGYVWDILPKAQARARDQVLAVLSPYQESSLGQRYNWQSPENIDRNFIQSNVSTTPYLPFYQNITGIVHGKWVRSRVVEGHQDNLLNLTNLVPDFVYTTKEYNRNITGSGGEVGIKLDEKKSAVNKAGESSIREIKAVMTIDDETSVGNGWDMTLHGVHFPESGSVLLTTSSEKFAGIFALPHFARSTSSFDPIKKLLNETIMATITRQQKIPFPSFAWQSSPNNPGEAMFPIPHCEYIVYLQQHVAVTPSKELQNYLKSIQGLEKELRFPTGAALESVPQLTMSAVIFSPDCGFLLESRGPPDFPQQEGIHLQGPKLEVHLRAITRGIQVFAVVIAFQIWLLVRQMKDTSTPSTKSRVSFYTIAMMSMGDGFALGAFLTVMMFSDAAFLTVSTAAMLAFLGVYSFGKEFLVDIWEVQAPERRERDRNTAPNTSSPPATDPAATQATDIVPNTTPIVIVTPAGADTLPLPVTAARPADHVATAVILPPDQDVEVAAAADDELLPLATEAATQPMMGGVRGESAPMYSRFLLTLLGIMFLSIYAATLPKAIRSIYANSLALTYLSFWVPQIYRNIYRNCRKALQWEYVVGQSLLRLCPFAYFYTVESNFLFLGTDLYMFYLFCTWLWVQICVLGSQDLLGPRLLIPKGWLPTAYDYHPILREDDEESGALMPLGFTQATVDADTSPTSPTDSKLKGRKTFDCAICMQNVDVPVILSRAGNEGASITGPSIFSRRTYMVTPCRHIFHSVCLEGWMKYRLQCPICRESLPPL